ncbi:hypothetical protein [Parvularcula lutaonensis]|uniref:Uncharacterized protein n=1 Tax=Parvularcula lutaonensis TaxID=491923 RepID=A0ABV7MEE2_9PROT|nr:hypothetical protein [Parvularcula lutaonensis]GGY55256.1 hypothetical protein GCM10007148_26390 [Parvularcula lutaonensis]
MPRNHRQKASRKKRDERIKRANLDDPFNGDTEALKAHLIAKLAHHARTLGREELLRRVRERGLEPPASAQELLDALRVRPDDPPTALDRQN